MFSINIRLLGLLALSGLVQAQQPGLSLPAAERLALGANPALESMQRQGSALLEAAMAAGELPDPKLKLGAMAVPINSFDLQQEPMTQLQIGIQQQFLPGDTLQLRRQQLEQQAAAVNAMTGAEELMILRSVRLAFVHLFHQLESAGTMDRSLELFSQLNAIVADNYAYGEASQQDVYRTDLELSKLRQRRLQLEQAIEAARAELGIWIGPASAKSLAPRWPRIVLPQQDLEDLQTGLLQHPKLIALSRRIDAAELAVSEARERLKPGYSIDLTYGNRSGRNFDGSHRDDFISLMFHMDLPLFKQRRQNRRIASNRLMADAELQQRNDELRRMQWSLQGEYSNYRQLQKQLQLYQSSLLPKAREAAAASLEAYQSASGDLSQLIQAELDRFELELAYLAVCAEQLKSKARLKYLSGEGE